MSDESRPMGQLGAWAEELRGPIHGRIQTIRGMCTDERPHVEIDAKLTELDELVYALSVALAAIEHEACVDRRGGRRSNRIIRARLVADNWRKAALEWGSDQIDARTMAHPLCCVLGALDGGKRPEDLGVNPESDEGRVLRAMEKGVIVENVPALNVRGLDVVLGDLAASGYDAEWDGLPAAAFGAPHLRARLWLLAYTGGEREQANDTVFAGRQLPGVCPWWRVAVRRDGSVRASAAGAVSNVGMAV